MAVLLFDNFDTPADDVDRTVWISPTGNAAFFGRTAIRNPASTAGDDDKVPVAGGSAHLRLSTHNPTALVPGDSFWGSEIDSRLFNVTAGMGGLQFEARVKSPEQAPSGLLTSLFTYRLINSNTTAHDEIDWEFVSKLYQPGMDPPHALLNRYDNEPLGAGHPVQVALAPGFEFDAFHTFTIRYFPNERIEWLVDNVVVDVATTLVPDGPMGVRLNIWAPGPEFAAAYDAALQPTADPGANVDYDFQVDWVQVASARTTFFDDHQLAAVAAILPGVEEPVIPIYLNGGLIAGMNHHGVELFDGTPGGKGFPSVLVDLAANAFVRVTYQKSNGTSGDYGTSFVGSFSYRPDGENLELVPAVDRADVSIGGVTRYSGVVSGHFGSDATMTSTRVLPGDPALGYTRTEVTLDFVAEQDIPLDTGTAHAKGDVFRAGTLSSMFSGPGQFDTSLLLWEDSNGDRHSLQLGNGTPRPGHLFDAPQDLGSWVELVKGAGSSWHPTSPTIRLVIEDTGNVQLGLQGFLAANTDPNADSLSVWLEVIDAPGTLPQGAEYAAKVAVVAVTPLVDNQTYLTPFSAKLEGTPFTNVTLIGAGNVDATGNTLDNVLTGNSGNNMLSGGSGNDLLAGGAGSDTALYEGAGSSVSVNLALSIAQNTLGAGTDKLVSIENVTGSGFADTLTGSSGNNVLDGGEGNDQLFGGPGNDTYVVDSTQDVVTEAANAGTDMVRSTAASFSLGANVEHLALLGTADISGTGNSLANTLIGNSGNNVLTGGAGTDTVSYFAAGSGVAVSLAMVGAQDTLGAGADTLVAIENLYGSAFDDFLTGSGAVNLLNGGNGNDTLDGGLGNDTLIGGLGNDTYEVNAATDVVSEAAGAGTDLVRSMVTYTLPVNVENLTLIGTSNRNATGNALNNVLEGNAGNNVLDGGAGVDTASYASAGGLVAVNLALAVAQNTLGAGRDTLVAIENVTGSGFGDILKGTIGNNVLDGGAGNDTLSGGAGNDTYAVDSELDAVSEAVNAGTDMVRSTAASFTLGANVEHLTLLGTADISGTGNSLANTLIGNSGNNVLNGGTGSDTASYFAAGSGVTVSLAVVGAQDTLGAGSDTLMAIENLYGSAFNDVLSGDAGSNVLNGGGGIDTASYAGAAAAVTASLAIAIAQNTAGGGTDKLLSFENLTGSAFNDILTGSTGANTLTGGAGNDVLRGLSAADVLFGGEGADTFDFDALADSGITAATRDSIEDFESADGDKIDLSTIDANAVLAGNQAFQFIGAAAFVNGSAAGKLRFDAVNHLLLGSTDADTAAEFSILLTGINSMVGGDFFL